MAHFDNIYEIAADAYGIVTAAQAREAGITTGEMNRWCAQGRLVRRGHGVYKLSKWIATPYDSFAEAVARVGQEAYLWGEAVLAMHNLALVDPPTIKVATPKRVRKELPPWVEVIQRPARAEITYYEGIPAQRVGDALRTCKNVIMPERL